ncbi:MULTISPECIES: hypothetical protein [unclassified Bradyrhizobium]|uniref:hypothetical protein n=1 Tax=unclassified Bradyrhizobium TaxID=2631580 RepID=UPI002915D08B|nr:MULTISPECIES: hypothetical protein [unclassified Bradyrhizobium]
MSVISAKRPPPVSTPLDPNSRPAQALARSVKAIVCEPWSRRSPTVALALVSATSGGRACASTWISASSIDGDSGRPS